MFSTVPSRRSLRLAVAVLLAGFALGCARVNRAGLALLDHPNPLVSLPAALSFDVGLIPSAPVYPVAALASRDPRAAEEAFFTANAAFEILGAGPFWLLFGWWGPQPPRLPSTTDFYLRSAAPPPLAAPADAPGPSP